MAAAGIENGLVKTLKLTQNWLKILKNIENKRSTAVTTLLAIHWQRIYIPKTAANGENGEKRHTTRIYV